MFEEIAKDFDDIYLIADALDEDSVETRSILLHELNALQSSARLLVTTRHIDSITREFDDVPIEIRTSDSDLIKYMTSRRTMRKQLSNLLKGTPRLKDIFAIRLSPKRLGCKTQNPPFYVDCNFPLFTYIIHSSA